jgi:hypothetical protein
VSAFTESVVEDAALARLQALGCAARFAANAVLLASDGVQARRGG